MKLNVDHVTKKYGQTAAVNDVSFQVKAGEFLAIVGPSGCGKSTLLRMIAGFVAVDSGEIVVDDRVLSCQGNTVAVEKRHIGMVFQSLALWPHMRVIDHVGYPLASQAYRKVGRQEKQAMMAETLAACGLSDFATRLPETLSGGQQQRVALARALVNRPSLLLLDEPLSALDAELKIHMRQALLNIQRETQSTFIYVTHDQSEAMMMADRVVVMKNGKIEQLGTPQEIYLHPQTEFVARFVGKYNLIPGTWQGAVFTSADQQFNLKHHDIAPYFIQAQCCPIRPDQFRMQESEGVAARVTARQYQGNCFLYTLAYHDQSLSVEAPLNQVYEPGSTVYLQLAL